jgi:sulfide:quinone oxidoreductase
MASAPHPAPAARLRVLVAGGGVAALEAVFALRALAGDLVDLELLAPEPRFYYQPLAVAEPFGAGVVQTVELSALAAAAGAQLTAGELASVSPEARVARTSHGMAIGYDALLIACGASPRPLIRDAITFRGAADTERIGKLVREAARGDVESVVLALPTRRTWLLPLYELAFGIRAYSEARLVVSTVEPAPLGLLGEAAAAMVRSLLVRDRIDLEPYPGDAAHTASVVVAAPELHARRIHGIPADDDGFISTNQFSAVHGMRDVYAAGDVTTFEVKHGSIAAAQAMAAAESIAARAGADLVPAPFRPIVRATMYCGRETIYARRDLSNPSDPGEVSRDPLWSPPAKIATRYLAPALARREEWRRGETGSLPSVRRRPAPPPPIMGDGAAPA